MGDDNLTCRNTAGTSLIYSGRAGNVPDNPQYGQYAPRVQNHALIVGVEYELEGDSPLPALYNHYVPCVEQLY